MMEQFSLILSNNKLAIDRYNIHNDKSVVDGFQFPRISSWKSRCAHIFTNTQDLPSQFNNDDKDKICINISEQRADNTVKCELSRVQFCAVYLLMQVCKASRETDIHYIHTM